jgi:hypothetical protein
MFFRVAIEAEKLALFQLRLDFTPGARTAYTKGLVVLRMVEDHRRYVFGVTTFLALPALELYCAYFGSTPPRFKGRVGLAVDRAE